jgi:uncharacterized protein (DUF58 family)
MLTRRGRIAVLSALVLLVAGRVLGVTELFGMAAAAVAAVVVAVARVRAGQVRISLSSRVSPSVVHVGEPASLELSVDNQGTAQLPPGRVRLIARGPAGPVAEVPRLLPGELATVALRLPTDSRGRKEVAGFDAIVTDELGLARRKVAAIGNFRYGVRPPVEHLQGTIPNREGSAGMENTRSAADRLRSGTSLLRPYVVGDEIRLVHWPTSARVGDLMVREGGDREQDASSGVSVVLSPLLPAGSESDWAYQSFEDAVRFAASLVAAAERDGSFRLVIPGRVDSGAGSGPSHLDKVMEELTDARPEQGAKKAADLLNRAALGSEEWSLILVGACRETADVPAVFGTAWRSHVGGDSTAVVLVCAGASEQGVDSAGRRQLLATVPIGYSLEELWSGQSVVLAGTAG